MKRLVEREFPTGTVEAKVSAFLREAEPFESPTGAKQRVRARLVGAPARKPTPWFFRLAVAVGVLAFAALAGAGVWRSTWRLHAQAPAMVVTEKAPEPTTAPVVHVAAPPAEVTPSAPSPSTPEGSNAARAPEPSMPKMASEPAAPSAHREAAAAESSVLFEATGALRRDGDPARASRILDDYFRKFPHGALGEEALALAIEAASARGDARARTLAKRYLDLYPKGNFRAKAERVIARTAE
jgi:hypothetical protein